MAKKKKKTFVEGVTGIGGSSLDERYLAKHDHGTFYGGLQITEEIKEELEAQPISDFMYFEPKGKSYIMKYQIPEKGMGAGIDGVEREYKIREYYNMCLKYFTKDILNADGTERFPKGPKYESPFYEEYYPLLMEKLGTSNPEKIRELANELEIPENETQEFSAFIHQNAPFVVKSVIKVKDRFDAIIGFEKLLVNMPAMKGKPEYAEAEKYIQDNIQDYVNTRNQLNDILDMDPKKEMRELSFLACDDSSSFAETLARQCTRLHQAKGEPNIGESGKHKSFSYGRYEREDNRIGKFPQHDVYWIPVTMNNEQCILTLETTAPPFQKAFFHPDEEFHGFGVYQNVEELEHAYRDPLQVDHTFKDMDAKEKFLRITHPDYIDNMKKEPDMKGKIKDVKFSMKGAKKFLLTDMAMAGYTVSKKGLGDLLRRLDKVDKWNVKSSDQFKKMRSDLEALKKIESLEDLKTKTENLVKSTEAYMRYKHPNGNPKKEGKMSDLAYSRLDFAREVLSFANTKHGDVMEIMLEEQKMQGPKKKIEQPEVKGPEEHADIRENDGMSFVIS